MAAPLTDLTHWARGNGLEIVLLVLGALLLTRFLRWGGKKIEDRIEVRSSNSEALVRSEQAKHRHAVVQVASYVALVLVYTVTGVLILSRFGVPVTSLVAPAAVLGVALGFGAQKFVQDLLAGFFVVAEKQYGFGDVIRLNLGSGIAPVTGTVEDVTLRVTQIRTADGEVVITPNGAILQVTNLSRDWARAVVDVPVPAGADVNAVTQALEKVGERAFASGPLKPLLLDEPTVMGVESLERDQLNIRVVARTLPGKQFEVSRELRSRVATALQKQGVRVTPGVDTVEPAATTAVRRSTIALMVAFAAVLALYLYVRPAPTPAAVPVYVPATVPSPTPKATPSRSPKPSATPSPRAILSPTATPSPLPSPTSSPSATPTPLPTGSVPAIP